MSAITPTVATSATHIGPLVDGAIGLRRCAVPADFDGWIQSVVRRVDSTLDRRLSTSVDEANRLVEAMRYATLGGGKRIRALLCHASGAMCGALDESLDEVGAAIEMVNAFTLVHDDLPAMDNDVLRRGRATVHVRYDEATAILVGDALQTQAFLTLCEVDLPSERRSALIHELAIAMGPEGVAGGQMIDLMNVGRSMILSELERMHRMKTGALISAAVRMGALCSVGDDPDHGHLFGELDAYSAAIGLAFQIVDDLLDVTSDTVTLGKTAGKDGAADKPTYVSLLGMDACRGLVEQLRRDAHAALEPLGTRAAYLRLLADRVVDRIT